MSERERYALIGAPLDAGTQNRCGERFSPAMIRQIAGLTGRKPAGITDLGDIAVKNSDPRNSLEQIASALSDVYEKYETAIVIGGSQIITLAELRALKEKYGQVSLVHFSSDRSISENGEVLPEAAEEELIDFSHSIQLGIRGGYAGRTERDLYKDRGLTVLEAYDMHRQSPDEIIQTIRKKVSDTTAIISIDLGFLDPVCAPATEDPRMGGFTTAELETVLHEIIPALHVASLDIVNLSYRYDAGDITTLAAEHILSEAAVSLGTD